jgi:hypothetical protein
MLYSFLIRTSFRIYKPLFFQLNGEFNYGWGGLKTRNTSYKLSYFFPLNGKSNHSIIASPFFGYSKILINDKAKKLQQNFSNAVAGLALYVPTSKYMQVFMEAEYVHTLKDQPANLSIQLNPLSIKAGVGFNF